MFGRSARTHLLTHSIARVHTRTHIQIHGTAHIHGQSGQTNRLQMHIFFIFFFDRENSTNLLRIQNSRRSTCMPPSSSSTSLFVITLVSFLIFCRWFFNHTIYIFFQFSVFFYVAIHRELCFGVQCTKMYVSAIAYANGLE